MEAHIHLSYNAYGGTSLRLAVCETRQYSEPEKEREIGSPWTHRKQNEALVWADLCDAARRLGLEIRQENLPEEARVQGGLVRVGNQRFFLVEARLPQGQKNELLVEALCSCEIQGIYLPPYLRELLQPKTETSPGSHRQERENGCDRD